MLGYAETEITHSVEEWFSRVHPQDIEQVKAAIAAHLELLTPHCETEYRILHKDGSYRWILCRGLAVRDADAKPYRIAGSQTDITDRKQAEEQLRHNAFYDALTQLPNRVLFMDRLSNAIARAKRSENYLFAVLFLDLDRFKVINDSLGHLVGDQLLIAIARRVETCLRAGDTFARLGGDEFTILLDGIDDVQDAIQVGDRILKELTLPFNLNGHEVFTTASIGIALSTTSYDKPEDVLRDADTTMYRAKAGGKARSEVFDSTMIQLCVSKRSHGCN
jgi:diguanylate cyclase (GGDEF)-like protein/PAS domain S-box-containing protein